MTIGHNQHLKCIYCFTLEKQILINIHLEWNTKYIWKMDHKNILPGFFVESRCDEIVM